MAERLVSDVLTKPDAALEMTLRPSIFAEFTGQAKVKDGLKSLSPPPNNGAKPSITFCSAGLRDGKNDLAHISPKRWGEPQMHQRPTIEKAGDLAGC